MQIASLPKRKPNRLKEYDYNTPGAYFITICTEKRKEVLSNINVGTGVLDCPDLQLYEYGKTANKIIKQLNGFYKNISIDNYVIMPNHIHFLISILCLDGQSGTPVPTKKDNRNSVISKFVSTFKRFCNKEYGKNIWQQRYYDHIIRNEQDYREIWEYIDNNPLKWEMDRFYNPILNLSEQKKEGK